MRLPEQIQKDIRIELEKLRQFDIDQNKIDQAKSITREIDKLDKLIWQKVEKKYHSKSLFFKLFISIDKFKEEYKRKSIRDFYKILVDDNEMADYIASLRLSPPQLSEELLKYFSPEPMKIINNMIRLLKEWDFVESKTLIKKIEEFETIEEKLKFVELEIKNRKLQKLESQRKVEALIYKVNPDSNSKEEDEIKDKLITRSIESANKNENNSYISKVLKAYSESGDKLLAIEQILKNKSSKRNLKDFYTPNISSNLELQVFINRILDVELRDRVVHHKGYKIFWAHGKEVKEAEFQDNLFNMLIPYFDINNIFYAREPEISNGKLDVAFAYNTFDGALLKVCVEIKKAHNNVENGISLQLPKYMDGFKTRYGIYCVLWFKNNKIKKPKYNSTEELKIRLEELIPQGKNIKVVILDVNSPISPSKLT